jgi:hypothetical protein
VSSHQPERTPPGARPAALLAVRITPADVGRRVTVRHRHDDTTLTDVVGRLLSWTPTGDETGAEPGDGGAAVLRVQRRDGSVAEIAVADVAAAKVVPEAPPRTTRTTGG